MSQNLPPTEDNLSKLPTELLIKIAADLPLADVYNLCNTSTKLARLCENETFWRTRIQQDFPQYFSKNLPQGMRAHDYYNTLYQVRTLTDVNGNDLLTPVQEIFTHENLSSVFLYPVPPFTEFDDGRLQGDIEVVDVFQRMYTVGFRLRESYAGVIPRPMISDTVKNRKFSYFRDVEERATYQTLAAELQQDKDYPEIYLLTLRELKEFLASAAELGYLQLSDMPTERLDEEWLIYDEDE